MSLQTSPVLAVLGSPSDEPLDWMNTGMALANILLLASSENVCCSFFESAYTDLTVEA